MSNCTIKTRKVNVKLMYENNFDFSYNDVNECAFESARNEIKLMLQQDLEFFLSKLRININGIDFPFLNNCEKCKIPLNDTEFYEKEKLKDTNPSDYFDEIFSLILDGNTKKTQNYAQGNYFKKEDSLMKKPEINSKSKTEQNNTSANPTINVCNSQSGVLINSNENNPKIISTFQISNENSTKENFNINKISNENYTNLENNFKIHINKNENQQNLNQTKPEEEGKKDKEDTDSDISSIGSSNGDHNIMKSKQLEIDGVSNLSYENLTVLEDAKSPRSLTQTKFKFDKIENKTNINKIKIGCFMEEKTIKQIDLLICDNFKSRYESSIHPNILKNTSINFSHKQLHMLEKNKSVNKNYKSYILYGNIAYSMGIYHKACKFYQTGINTMKEEIKENSNDQSNCLIFKCLLQNNLAKCMMNLLNIKGSINILETAYLNLNEKIIFLEDHSDRLFVNKIKNLRLIIEFNLAEAYFCMHDYEKSSFILDKIFEELTSDNTLKYYDSTADLDISFDDKQISKSFVRYYYISGKIQFRLDNHQLALDYLNQSIFLRRDEKNEHKEDQAQVFNYIALIYCKQNQFEKAIKYINKVYDIYWLLYGEDHVKTNLIALNHSYILKMKNENLKALEIINNAKENSSKSKENDKIFDAVFYRAIGTCYFEMENEIKGLTYYSKANNIYKKYHIVNKVTMNEINSIILNLYGLVSI